MIETLAELTAVLSDLIKDPKVFTLALTLAFTAKCESTNLEVVTPTQAQKVNVSRQFDVGRVTHVDAQKPVLNHNIIIEGDHFYLVVPNVASLEPNNLQLPVYLSGEGNVAVSTENKLRRNLLKRME